MKHYLVITAFSLMMTLLGCNENNQENRPREEGDFLNQLTEQEISGGKLTAELLWKFGRVGDMQLSPDGKTVLYTVTRYDAKTDKKHTWIFSVPSEGGQSFNMTDGLPSCVNPRWINNSAIAFLSKEKETMQIWRMNADGSDKTVISEIEGDVNGFEFAPDGSHLFYLQDVKMDSAVQDRYPDLPLAKGLVFDDLMYRHWDAWTDYAYSHIFVTRFTDGRISKGADILIGEHYDSPLPPYFDIADIAWSPDGVKLAYSCKKLKGKDFAISTNSDIYLYDVEGNTTENITDGMAGYDRYPVFSPDSRKIAFMSMETPGYEADKERLFIYDIENRTREYVTSRFDQNAEHYVWSSDSRKLYFISGTQATYQVYEAVPENGGIRQVTKGEHDFTSIALSSNVMTGTKSTLSMAPEIYRIDPGTGQETQLTFVNKNIYDVIRTGKVEEKRVKTTDGKDMLVWVVFPPDFNPSEKYPALLYCQGGPQSAVSQRFSYRWNLQLMAANGYIVVAPNRRGLPTFGQKWNEQISGDYGGQNIRDYLSAIDAVKKEPYVDADRLGAVGASYGGYSVLYLAGMHEKRFKVFIAHCGMFNLESQSAATEEMFFVHHDLGGYYWDKPKPKSFTQFSPHLYVDKWDTPIMLITGANDFRIPYTESLQAFNVAQLRGIPSRLLFYPDEGHWVMKPQNSILWQREFFGWLDQWLK
jgi:dipeptidyl aminopeptidase/acylaminoacyl peptidase